MSRAIFRSVNSFSLSFTSFGSDGTGTGCDEGAANTGWYTGGVGAAICVMGANGGGYQFCTEVCMKG